MKIHIVKRGETLARIAKKYQVPLEKLREINQHIKHGEKLTPGMKVKVPTAQIRLKPKLVTAVSDRREKEAKTSAFQPAVSDSVESASVFGQAARHDENEFASKERGDVARDIEPPPYPFAEEGAVYSPYFYPHPAQRGWHGSMGAPSGFNGHMTQPDYASPLMANCAPYAGVQPYASYAPAPYECASCGAYSYSPSTYGAQPVYPWSGSGPSYSGTMPHPSYFAPQPFYGREGEGAGPEGLALPTPPPFDNDDRLNVESSSV